MSNATKSLVTVNFLINRVAVILIERNGAVGIHGDLSSLVDFNETYLPGYLTLFIRSSAFSLFASFTHCRHLVHDEIHSLCLSSHDLRLLEFILIYSADCVPITVTFCDLPRSTHLPTFHS